MHDPSHSTGLFATNAAAASWWAVDLLYRHGPDWQVLPPLLIAAASLVGAVRGFANDRQSRRHKEERHRIEIQEHARKRREQL